jgi:hypothetical protein
MRRYFTPNLHRMNSFRNILMALFLLIPAWPGAALATPEAGTVFDDHPEWTACTASSDCTSIKAGCYYWQPINKRYLSAVPVSACLASTPPGPQPTTGCVKGDCQKDPYTVRFWDSLEASQKYYEVYFGVEACRTGSGLPRDEQANRAWVSQYEPKVESQIHAHRFPPETPILEAVKQVVPCAELLSWEAGQRHWAEKQHGLDRQVLIDRVEPMYSLGDLYPPLIAYGAKYQTCAQSSTRPGVTFSGELNLRFTINAKGQIDPDRIQNTYPAVANMRPFFDCLLPAFKSISFRSPKNGAAIRVDGVIRINSAQH